VLIVGKHYQKIKEVAASYGFKRAVTVEELHLSWPHLYPDMPPVELPPAEVPAAIEDNNNDCGGQAQGNEIAAVLLMTDPLLWGRELQIVCDVLRAKRGNVAAACNTSIDGGSSTPFVQHVQVHNACADFTYAAKWPVARFGCGAFRLALERLWLKLSTTAPPPPPLSLSLSQGGRRRRSYGRRPLVPHSLRKAVSRDASKENLGS